MYQCIAADNSWCSYFDPVGPQGGDALAVSFEN
jgi:hypothetical protein